MNKLLLVLLFLLSLPVLLFIYQPAWHLGAFGLLLGFLGMTISPLVLYGVLIVFIKDRWNK